MHLIYRSKKQTLPTVPLKQTPSYFASIDSQPNVPSEMLKKKSIDIIFGRHKMNATEAVMFYNPPQRKTFYRRSKSKRVQSVYLKANNIHDQSSIAVRNDLINKTQRQMIVPRIGEFSPYGKKRSKSISKFKLSRDGEHKEGDRVCQRLIEREIYCVEENSDFS